MTSPDSTARASKSLEEFILEDQQWSQHSDTSNFINEESDMQAMDPNDSQDEDYGPEYREQLSYGPKFTGKPDDRNIYEHLDNIERAFRANKTHPLLHSTILYNSLSEENKTKIYEGETYKIMKENLINQFGNKEKLVNNFLEKHRIIGEVPTATGSMVNWYEIFGRSRDHLTLIRRTKRLFEGEDVSHITFNYGETLRGYLPHEKRRLLLTEIKFKGKRIHYEDIIKAMESAFETAEYMLKYDHSA